MEFTLSSIESSLWQLLERGRQNAKHPFHTPTLGTVWKNTPRLRTVVLRAVDPHRGELACHTDYRSEKVREVEMDPYIQWHFYAPKEKMQIRLGGLAALHYQNERAKAGWEASNLSCRRIYLLTSAPGTARDQPDSAMPPELQGRVPTEEESREGWANFAVLTTRITTIDWLYLSSSGHLRAQFHRTSLDEESKFCGSWVTP